MFLVEVSLIYNQETIAIEFCHAGKPIQRIMQDYYESTLKSNYNNWPEARSYLRLEGIARKKKDQILNKVEKYETIYSDDWFNYGFDFKKLKATFEMKPAQAFLQRIMCNL